MIPIAGGIPWWMVCIGAVSAVVTITGVIIWQVIQSRLEKQEEAELAAGKGMAPPSHPEPLHGWVTQALAFLDGGSSWMDATPEAGQNLLNDWGVNSVPLLDLRVGELAQQQPARAWHALRALRMILAARAAHHLDPAGCWNRARPIAQWLQRSHPGFDAIAQDYLAGLREWKRLPADGSGDDAELLAFRGKLDAARAQGWRGVGYMAAI